MKIYVTIQGPVSAMKSPMARLIQDAIKKTRLDLSCTVFDHELFAFDANFDAALQQVKQDAASSPHDVCVIVVGTGTDQAPLTVQVEPALPGAPIIFNAVTAYLAQAALNQTH